VQTTKAYGEIGAYQLGSRWREVNLTFRPLYPGERAFCAHKIWGLVCTRTVLDTLEKRQISLYCSKSNKVFLCLQFPSLFAISTRLFRLSVLTTYDFNLIRSLTTQINQPVKRNQNATNGKDVSCCLNSMKVRYLLRISAP